MKHILTLIFISTLAFTTIAQNIDEERMHRDLEVAENALNTIIDTQSDEFPNWHMGGKDVEADFIKDYGVVFVVDGNGHSNFRIYNKSKNKDKNKAKGMNKDSDVIIDLKKISEEETALFIEHCKTFLADYAGIIGQLNDNHKISIRRGGSDSYGGNNSFNKVYFANMDSEPTTIWKTNSKTNDDNELIIEATVGNITKLRREVISREDFFKSVTVVENVMSYEKDADLETLSAMFYRLYKKDLSNTYYSERQPKYSKLSNFGVIIKMKFYSSYEDDNVYSMPTIDKDGLTLSQRNTHVMELLPKFESEFKENLVNYGRTLKNLDSEEILMFEVNMTTCKDCKDFPRYMKFSIKKSALHKFNKGDISMEKAIGMVNVERLMK